MIISFELTKGQLGLTPDLLEKIETVSYSRLLSQVKYMPVIKILRDHAETKKLIGVLIPSELAGTDYNAKFLVEHIRTESDKRISHVPVIIVPREDEHESFVKSFDEDRYQKIGVVVKQKPNESDFPKINDSPAWKRYRDQAGLKPQRTGSHDQANEWGAYALHRALSAIDYTDAVEDHTNAVEKAASIVEDRLCEDTFYKKRVAALGGKADQPHMARIKTAKSTFLQQISNIRTILIVEDQLEDGWESAYRFLFEAGSFQGTLEFANNDKIARKVFNNFKKDIDLIVLDVRLREDRERSCQGEDKMDVSHFSGVKLARWFHKQEPTVPILTATASNKSWTLEALMNEGVSAYWVKGGADSVDSIDSALTNLLDLYRKISSVLGWSLRTRRWIDVVYQAAEIVYSSNATIGERLKKKAKSLHALLFRSFDPFRADLAKGLQMNLSFLVVYSCMNDLIDWVLEKEESGDEVKWWFTGADGKRERMVERLISASSEGYRYDLFRGEGNPSQRMDFPDTEVAKMILVGYQLNSEARIFRDMSKKRNGLPLIHGKSDDAGSTSVSVEQIKDEDIDQLTSVVEKLIEVHKKSGLAGI